MASTNAVIDAGPQQDIMPLSVGGFVNIACHGYINKLEINQKSDTRLYLKNGG